VVSGVRATNSRVELAAAAVSIRSLSFVPLSLREGCDLRLASPTPETKGKRKV
jgi:hypothetical protein